MSEELPLKWSIEPKERVRALSELASGTVNVSPTIPIKRYYRSGIELEKMVIKKEKSDLSKKSQFGLFDLCLLQLYSSFQSFTER